MIFAHEARKIAEIDVSEEIKIIENKIRDSASKNRYETEHEMPYSMKKEAKEKVFDIIRSHGYDLVIGEDYDPKSGWSTERITIGWEEDEC